MTSPTNSGSSSGYATAPSAINSNSFSDSMPNVTGCGGLTPLSDSDPEAEPDSQPRPTVGARSTTIYFSDTPNDPPGEDPQRDEDTPDLANDSFFDPKFESDPEHSPATQPLSPTLCISKISPTLLDGKPPADFSENANSFAPATQPESPERCLSKWREIGERRGAFSPAKGNCDEGIAVKDKKVARPAVFESATARFVSGNVVEEDIGEGGRGAARSKRALPAYLAGDGGGSVRQEASRARFNSLMDVVLRCSGDVSEEEQAKADILESAIKVGMKFPPPIGHRHYPRK